MDICVWVDMQQSGFLSYLERHLVTFIMSPRYYSQCNVRCYEYLLNYYKRTSQMEFFVQNIFKNILSRLESPQLVNYPSSSLPPPSENFPKYWYQYNLRRIWGQRGQFDLVLNVGPIPRINITVTPNLFYPSRLQTPQTSNYLFSWCS